MQSEYILVASFIVQVFTAICYSLIAPHTNIFFLGPIFETFLLSLLVILTRQLSHALIS